MENQFDNKLTTAAFYLEAGRPERALQTLDGVDENTLDSAQYWRIRGSALYDQKAYQEASAALAKGLELEPDDVYLLHVASSTFQMLGNLASAEKAVLQALDISPNNADLLSKYAELVAGAGQFDKAARLLDEASDVDPEDENVVRARFVVATMKGDDNEARRLGEEWLAKDPDSPDVLSATGMTLIGQGNVRRGYDRLRRAASFGPHVIEGSESIFEYGKYASHWLLIPLWPINRFGPVIVWISAMAILIGIRSLGFTSISGILSFVWIGYAIYTWVAPPLVRRLTSRRYR